MIARIYNNFSEFVTRPVSIAPLVTFRIVFGGVLLYSTVRMLQKGWVHELFIQPTYHFSFINGVEPLGERGMYILFFSMAFCAVGIILGLFYRVCSLLFFLLFTYCELIDKTFYLNHYYLVSILTFWLVIVPANRYYSLDSK
ncbi:MAG: HTTM domain-containing protein, partial [Bacteroidota bacterium]